MLVIISKLSIDHFFVNYHNKQMKQKLIILSPDVCLKVIVRSERYLGTLPLRSQETTGLIKSNVDSSKKVLSQLFLYFSLYIETEIYKLIYVS